MQRKETIPNRIPEQYLSSLIFGKQVSVRFKEIDRYGRVLGVIYCDGAEINLVMVQNGYAWHYSYYDKTPAYIQAEKQARADKKGLWADPNPINPYQFRKSRKNADFLKKRRDNNFLNFFSGVFNAVDQQFHRSGQTFTEGQIEQPVRGPVQ